MILLIKVIMEFLQDNNQLVNSDGQTTNGNGVSNNSDEEDPENIGNYV